MRVADVGAVGALLLTAHTVINARLLRRPAGTTDERVSAIVPARDEARVIARCVTALWAAGADEVIVVDDGSSDGTAALVRPPSVVVGSDPPAGALGKPWACRVGASHATGTVLAFVDADVVVRDLRSSVATMRALELALVSPYPQLIAASPLERLVQPLLRWSWLTFLPLRWAERSTRPSLSAAGGQLLIVDASAYQAVGGHPPASVLDDIDLLKALKRQGFRGVVLDGHEVASVRMYDGAKPLVDGYAKSLHAAFGSPLGSLAVVTMLMAVYVAPLLALVRRRSALLLAGSAAGIGGRVVAGSGADALAHPVSVLAFAGLNGVSWWRHLRGTNAWRGRRV